MGNRNEKHVSSAYVRMKQQSARFKVNILCTRFEVLSQVYVIIAVLYAYVQCICIKWNDDWLYMNECRLLEAQKYKKEILIKCQIFSLSLSEIKMCFVGRCVLFIPGPMNRI